jgi:L-iditol 2-dehydrogenase
MLMKQVVLQAPQDVRVVEAPRPDPGPDELLIAIARVGICGSDLHAYHGQHPFIELPVVPGHEFSGTVVKVGPAVADCAPGQRVTVEPSLVCGVCYNCTHGRYNICEQLRVIGCQTTGAMAEYLSVPAAKTVLLPENVSWDQAALVEPLAVGVHAVRVASISPGARILVMGAGTIGLMVLQAAKAMGAGPVMITDLMDDRLELACRLGVDAAVNPSRGKLEQAVEKTFGVDGADVIVECVGVAATVRDAVRIARKGTRIVLAGVFEQEVPVNLGLVQDRELELVGTLMYAGDDFQLALRFLQEGTVAAEPIISHHFPLEQAAQAFAIADSRQDALKVLLQVAD